MNRIVKRTRSLVLVAAMALTASLTGCLAAAAGAGAAGAIYFTQRGASSLVKGDLSAVYGRAEEAFRHMNVTETGHSTEDNGKERELEGKAGDREVKVEMKRKSNTTTEVEVTVRRNAVEWDKEFARELLSRIVSER